jgi:antirestriction protein ArdC
MKNKRQLTPEQVAKRDERKAAFKALWKQVAEMPEGERATKFETLPFVNVEGKAFSGKNMMLLALQGGGSVFGGFRQWIEQGRAVRKGEHGRMIWVPIFKGNDSEGQEPAAGEVEAVERRFIIGTVFDISQTDAIETQKAA